MAGSIGLQGSHERRRGGHGQQARPHRLGGSVQRQRLPISSHASLIGAEKLACGSEALRAPTFPHFDDESALHRSLHRATRTKEQSQRRVCSLVLRMVVIDRATYKDRHARNSSWPGDQSPPKGRVHLRRLVFSTKLPPCSRAADHTYNTYIHGTNPPIGSTYPICGTYRFRSSA